MKKHKKINKSRIIGISVTIIVLITIFLIIHKTIQDPDTVTSMIKSAGTFGPIVLILIMMLGVLFSPIPNVVFIVLAGYLYGAWSGAIYSYIGHVAAALSTFLVIRTFKNKSEENKKENKYEKIIMKNKNLLYVFFGIPLVPISISSTISASSKIQLKEFIKIILLSFIPMIILFSFFGERISHYNLVEIGVWLVIIIILGAIIFTKIIKKNNLQQLSKN